MVDDGIYTKNADIAVRAGLNVNATAATTAETDKYVLAVEAMINSITRTDWSTAWTAGLLKATVKVILTECSASFCAMKVINYDPNSLPTLLEAQTRLDVLNDIYKQTLKALKDDKELRRFVVT